MKILHSSDWHLGVELEGHSRAEEQQHFLDWLLERLAKESIDVLLMAGDIFHQSNPSSAAQAMFYDFVQRLSAIPTLRHAVFIGGNHDSAARLEAPTPLLVDRKVTLIGGYLAGEHDGYLVPIEGESDDVELVVVAVPYVHEVRLGVSPVSFESEDLRGATVSAFTNLYTTLAEGAKSRWPNANIVGMGHLTCGDATEDDYGTALHNVGTIESLPPSIFCPTLYRYVALGHIHRGYRVGSGPANYSGSPLTMRFNSSELTPRQVVEVDSTTGEYARIAIPILRKLKNIRGPLDTVKQELRTLKGYGELDTWVNVDLETDELMLDVGERLNALVAPNVRILNIYRHRGAQLDLADTREPLPDVRKMTPRSIFETLYGLHHPGAPPSDNILRKFDQAALAATGGDDA